MGSKPTYKKINDIDKKIAGLNNQKLKFKKEVYEKIMPQRKLEH